MPIFFLKIKIQSKFLNSLLVITLNDPIKYHKLLTLYETQTSRNQIEKISINYLDDS